MKYPKLLSLTLAAAITASTLVPSCALALISGDVNGDGAITSDDLSLLQGYVLGRNELSKDQAASADINGDNIINSSDVSKLRKTILTTAKELSFKSVVDRLTTGYTDNFKKIDASKSEVTVKSTAELKSALSPYLSESIVNSYASKYNDNFFAKSVLLLKPFYFAPEKYSKNGVYTKLSCGCDNSYAGIYTPDSRVDVGLNIRKEHTAASDSLGQIPPGAKFTVTYANGTGEGKFGHVTYNGISGYVNMGWVTKVSDLAPSYTSIPDIQISSVHYDSSKITVTAKEAAAGANVSFSAAIIAQAIIPKKEYYASAVTWTVTTTSTTTTTTTTTCPYPLAKARMDEKGIKELRQAFDDCSKLDVMKYVDWKTDKNIPMKEYAEFGFKTRTGNCYVMAAMFCEMAKLLGYDARQLSGTVSLGVGGRGPHSWVEIKIDGTVYVFDPDCAYECYEHNSPNRYFYYMTRYGASSQVWDYISNGVIN